MSDAWHDIMTQQQADDFMDCFADFHDATLESLAYTEGQDTPAAVVTLNSIWCGRVELCFEGVQAVNLRPSPADATRAIQEATLLVKYRSAFWADARMSSVNCAHDGTFIHALSMKWRRIG